MNRLLRVKKGANLLRVLIVRKFTSFELLRDRLELAVPLGLLSDIETASFKQSHDEHEKAISDLRSGLTAKGIAFSEIYREDPWPEIEEFTHIITVGGDGTVLSVAHQVKHAIPVIGIRSSDSSIGYLCSYGHLEVFDLIRDLLENDLQIIRVQRLRIEVERLENQGMRYVSSPVLNEVLFSHSHPAGTARYAIEWDGIREMHRSSGIWICTAIGSTGAMAAAGGQRLGEQQTEFQFRVRELFHPPSGRLVIGDGVFDPDKSPLVIENRSDNSLLAFDGLHGSTLVGFGDRIRVERAESLLLARGK